MLNFKFIDMISGKGILYMVLGAAGAAVVAGTMITGGTRGEKLRKLGSGIQNFLGSLNQKNLKGPAQNSKLAESNDTGHA